MKTDDGGCGACDDDGCCDGEVDVVVVLIVIVEKVGGCVGRGSSNDRWKTWWLWLL